MLKTRFVTLNGHIKIKPILFPFTTVKLFVFEGGFVGLLFLEKVSFIIYTLAKNVIIQNIAYFLEKSLLSDEFLWLQNYFVKKFVL